MTEVHQKVIEELAKIHKSNPKNIALIICGSVAAGKARVDSDVDLYLVVTDKEYERVKKSKDYFYGTWDPTEFYGIEIDGKIISMQFLRDAVLNADEPTRASFMSAYTAFSHNKEVVELINKIAVYPEWERNKKLKAFYAYVKHYRYVGEQAFKLNNDFLVFNCVNELFFFAGRLILTHNRVLFPCHKSLFDALKKCKEMPDNFIEKSHNLLKNINLKTMIDYYELTIDYFKDYDYPDKERIGLILENEQAWFTKKMPVKDW